MSRSVSQLGCKHNKVSLPGRQKAFTVVEIMIAGLLGVILLSGVVQLFLGSNQNYRLQGELAGIQEDGRFALAFLERQLQQGGWFEDYGQFIDAVDFTVAADGENDTVVIRFYKATDGSSNVDCNGAVVASGQIINRFFVQDENLMCLGNGGGVAQPFLSNVEKFQVLYGVETELGCPDGAPNQYMTRDTLVNSGVNTYTGRVVSIKVGLVLRSENEILQENNTDEFQLLDQTYTPPEDKFIRRLFQQTTFMPNAVFSATSNSEALANCQPIKSV